MNEIHWLTVSLSLVAAADCQQPITAFISTMAAITVMAATPFNCFSKVL
jgi:hypothetical protein